MYQAAKASRNLLSDLILFCFGSQPDSNNTEINTNQHQTRLDQKSYCCCIFFLFLSPSLLSNHGTEISKTCWRKDRPENQVQSSLVPDSHNSSSPRVDAVQQYAGFLTSVSLSPTLRFLVYKLPCRFVSTLIHCHFTYDLDTPNTHTHFTDV